MHAGGAVAGVEEVSVLLQRKCPSYFKEDDRAFYQVRILGVLEEKN
jgi:hypothetical protein